MELRLWLCKNRITIKDFSDKLGYTREYIGNICSEKHIPSVYLAKRISKFTNGEVSVMDLLKIRDDENSLSAN